MRAFFLAVVPIVVCQGLQYVQLSINLVAILYLLISEISQTTIKCEFGTCLSINLELSSCYVLTSSSLSYLCELEYSQLSI